MKAVAKRAAAVLDLLTWGLDAPSGSGKSSRRIGGEIGESAIMPVSVERIADDFYSVAHYYRQHGELLTDPEIVYWKKDGQYYPSYMKQEGGGGFEVEMIRFKNGQPTHVNLHAQKDAAAFTTTWMANIRVQQADGLAALSEERNAAKGRTVASPVQMRAPSKSPVRSQVTAPAVEAVHQEIGMSDNNTWDAEANAIWSTVQAKLLAAIPAGTTKGNLLREEMDYFTENLIPGLKKKLAGGWKFKGAYLVGPTLPGAVPEDAEDETVAAPPPRVSTPPRVSAPPVVQAPSQSPKASGTKFNPATARAAIQVAWERFTVQNPQYFVTG